MVNRVRSPSNAIVLLGTFGCRFISNPGLHSKKRKLGTRIAIVSKCHRKSKKAGSTVKVGSGEYRVGTPEANNPTQAGMSKQIPAAMTMRRRFTSVVITRVEDYFKSGVNRSLPLSEQAAKHRSPASFLWQAVNR